MKITTRTTPTMLATAPAWIESAPSSAPTVRSSRIVIGAGRAGAQQERKIACRLHREAARNDAAAAEDRLADDRRADHLAVEHDGEGLADILAGRIAEAPRPGRVELEADDRLVLLEGGLCIGQRVAAGHARLPHTLSRRRGGAIAPPLLGGKDLVARRQATAPGFVHGHAGIHQLKCQLGGAPQQILDVLGIVDPRELDQDTVLPLTLDRRLLGASFVDAAADDLDGLLDRLAAAGFGCQRTELHRPGAVTGERDGELR